MSDNPMDVARDAYNNARLAAAERYLDAVPPQLAIMRNAWVAYHAGAPWMDSRWVLKGQPHTDDWHRGHAYGRHSADRWGDERRVENIRLRAEVERLREGIRGVVTDGRRRRRSAPHLAHTLYLLDVLTREAGEDARHTEACSLRSLVAGGCICYATPRTPDVDHTPAVRRVVAWAPNCAAYPEDYSGTPEDAYGAEAWARTEKCLDDRGRDIWTWRSEQPKHAATCIARLAKMLRRRDEKAGYR